MTEDEGWCPHLFFFVLDNRNALSFVVHSKCFVGDVDFYLCCLTSADVIRGIDKYLVKYLVQGWYDLQLTIVDVGIGPRNRFVGTYVRVGAFENVIYVG